LNGQHDVLDRDFLICANVSATCNAIHFCDRRAIGVELRNSHRALRASTVTTRNDSHYGVSPV
jgi:hypothetical protein